MIPLGIRGRELLRKILSILNTASSFRYYFDQWLPLLLTQSDVEHTFQTMQQAGVKVLRTWVCTLNRSAWRETHCLLCRASTLSTGQKWLELKRVDSRITKSVLTLERLESYKLIVTRYGTAVRLLSTQGHKAWSASTASLRRQENTASRSL